jgi:hypothetical protein
MRDKNPLSQSTQQPILAEKQYIAEQTMITALSRENEE